MRNQYHTTSSNAPINVYPVASAWQPWCRVLGMQSQGAVCGALTIRHRGGAQIWVASLSSPCLCRCMCYTQVDTRLRKQVSSPLSVSQLQNDGQVQRKCVSLLTKWEEWFLKGMQWKQLSRKYASKWLRKTKTFHWFTAPFSLTPRGCSWGPSLLNTPSHMPYTDTTQHTRPTGDTQQTPHTHIHTLRKSKILKLSPICNYSVQFSSVAQSCPTLCDPMNRCCYIHANQKFSGRHKVICKVCTFLKKFS